LNVAVIARNLLWRHLLTPPVARGKPLSFRSPPTVRTATKTSSPMRRALACRARNQSRSRFKRNIIMEWRTASRARASLVRSAGLGWVSDSRPKLEWAMKNSERVARPRSVGKNLNSTQMRREFSRYPYHSLSGAISSVQHCGEAPGYRRSGGPDVHAFSGSAVTQPGFVGRCCCSRDLR